jgi:hypothetical protein
MRPTFQVQVGGLGDNGGHGQRVHNNRRSGGLGYRLRVTPDGGRVTGVVDWENSNAVDRPMLDLVQSILSAILGAPCPPVLSPGRSTESLPPGTRSARTTDFSLQFEGVLPPHMPPVPLERLSSASSRRKT